MKCSECDKDFEAGVKSAYKLGLMDGENRLNKTISKVKRNNNVILRANHRLTQEVLRLNDIHPLAGTPSVIIPIKKAKTILGVLPKNHPISTYLQRALSEQLYSLKS